MRQVLQPFMDMRQAIKLEVETHHDKPSLVAPRVLVSFLPDACAKPFATADHGNRKQFQGTTIVSAVLLFSSFNTIS